MGYSIVIQVKSDETRRKFLKFIQENFRHWNMVSGVDSSEWQGSAGEPTDDLSYGGTKTSIGFDYQSGMYGFERDYLYSVLRWMAIKVGDRKTRMVVDKDDEGAVAIEFPEPTPYYVYDGEKNLNPVLVVPEEQVELLDKSPRHWAVDEWGVRIGASAIDHQIGSCIKLIGAIILGDEGETFKNETATLGPRPTNGIGEEAWWAKRREIYLKYLKVEIDKNVSCIRQEIQRLDQLWAHEISSSTLNLLS